MPSVAAVQTTMDSEAAIFKRLTALGLGLNAELTTAAWYAQQAVAQIMGDGTTTNPGIDNADLQAILKDKLLGIADAIRYDRFSQIFRSVIASVEQTIIQSQPAGWNLTKAPSGTTQHALDALLKRFNATDANTPAKPSGTPVLTATTGGSIAPCTSGNAPYFGYSFVGLYDYWESPISALAAQVALSGKNNAYSVASVQSPIPSGVYKIRKYRSLTAGPNTALFYISDQAVSPGDTGVTLSLTESDIQLIQTITPAVFAQLLFGPEAAAIFALAFATPSQQPSLQNGLFSFQNGGMLSPKNVALNPIYVLSATLSYNFLGVNNPISTGEFARWTSTVFAQGTIPLTNNSANDIQGFIGASAGIQLRTIATLNAGAVITNLNYKYLDATNPITEQSGTIAAPGTLSTAVDSTLDMAIPAGRIVTQITGVTVGTATTGTFIAEAKAGPRTI
jgi:hypothetical protein